MPTPTRSALLLAVAGVVSSFLGCVNPNTRFVPDPGPTAATVAPGYVRQGLIAMERYQLLAVDGRYLLESEQGREAPIAPGSHELLLYVSFPAGGALMEAFAPLSFKLEEKRAYILDGRIGATSVEVWLADAQSKQRVSEVAVAGIGKRATTPVPVVTPIPSK